MPAYKFTDLPAGRPVSVYPAAGGDAVSTGTTDSNGVYTVTLDAGNYTAKVTSPRDGSIVETAEELVTPVDPDALGGGSGASVPVPAPEDAGKALVVGDDGVYSLGVALPAPTEADAGKSMVVDGAGFFTLAPPGGGAPAFVHVGMYGNAAPTGGGDASLDLVDNRRVMIATVPQTFGAGEGGGLVPYMNASGANLADYDGLLLGSLELAASNADGTEKLVLWSGALPLTDLLSPDMTTWDVREQIGTDLALSADGTAIESTAGGQFICSAFWKLQVPA